VKWSGVVEARSALNSSASGNCPHAIEDRMRNFLVALVVAALTVASASAEPSNPKKRDQGAAPGRLPAKRLGASNPCSAYGPGFVIVDGTETCVKIGGAVSVGIGSSTGPH
jgi:Porin subfamily